MDSSRPRTWFPRLGSDFLRRAVFFFVVCLLLALATRQDPLYSANQNTKFLHGMARAGVGYLDNDWLAQTRDGLPLFSTLVFAIYAFLSPLMVYVLYTLLLGVLFFSLVGILCATFEIRRDSLNYYLLCGSVLWILAGWNGLYDGVAQQYLLGGYLQPCVFGVFIVLSVRLFLERRETWASASLALACLMHPAYLFIGSLFIMVYLAEGVRERRGWKAALAALGPFLICTTAYLLYLSVEFRPTSAQAFDQAMQILAVERIPHHSLIGVWAGPSAFAKLVLVLLSLYLLRRKPLFRILSWLTAATLFFTWMQAVTHSNLLALLAPWRASVVIVPLALFSVVAWLIHRLPEMSAPELRIRRNILISVSAFLLLVSVLRGVKQNVKHFKKYASAPEMALFHHISAHKQPQDVYIIPNHDSVFEKFRLETGAPVFVNWKSHPYKDIEVLDWSQRNRLIDRLYGASIQELPQILEMLRRHYHVTHVVTVPGGQWGACPLLNPEFSDASFILFRIRPVVR